MPAQPIFRVALPGPLRTLFDYLPVPDPPKSPQPGMRVSVPFNRGSRCGLLMEITPASELPRERLKPAIQLLDQTPLLAPRDLQLLRWAASYYQHPLGDVVFHALPTRLRKGLAPLDGRPDGWRLSEAGRRTDPGSLTRAPRQAELLRVLGEHPAGLPTPELRRRCGDCGAILRSLRAKQWVEPCRSPPLVTPLTGQASQAPRLSTAQQSALEVIRQGLGHFAAFLLDGVTGSGKTEVYLQLIQQLAQQGRQSLVLVPEIGLTPQLVRRFEARLRQPVALLHSGLAEGGRERAWLAARSGEARVLVGTRSAVFTPMPNLALIIVDEEHYLSLKQQEGFRYSARDLALVRARLAGCPVVLGSATPSLESLRNAQLGRYRHLSLPSRAGRAQLPELALLDVRSVHLDGGLSPALLKQIRSTLDAGE